MQISFLIEKNLDLHLMKMQISFFNEKKDMITCRFLKQKIDLDNKNIKNIFQ